MSLFSGLSQAQPPPPPPPDSLGDGDLSGGGDAGPSALFSGLSSGGGSASAFNFISDESAAAPAPSGGGLSAFGFIGDEAGASTASTATAPSALSAFNFIGSDDAATSEAGSTSAPSAPSAFGFLGSSTTPEAAAPEPSGTTSMFSFMNNPATEVTTTGSLLGGLSMATPAPAPVTTDLLGGLSMASPPPATAPAASLPLDDTFNEPAVPRKKTRKAMLPGHAARANDSAGAAATGAEATSEPVAEPAVSSSMPVEPRGSSEDPFADAAPESKPPPPPAITTPEPVHIPPPPPEPEPAPQSATTSPTKPMGSLLAGLTPAAAPVNGTTASAPAPPPPPPSVDKPTIQETASQPPPPQPVEQFQPAARMQEPAAVASVFAAAVAAAQAETASQPPPPPPPPPEPAEQTLDTAFNLEGVQQLVETKLAASMEEHRALLEQQAACLARSQRMTSDVASLRQKMTDTEAEQNRLCDAEQFEEAEALESTIQQLKDAISRRLEEVAGTAREMDNLARSLLDLTKKREVLAEQTLERMQSLQTDGEESLAEKEDRTHRRLASETARLDSERKRMQLASSHLDKDSGNLDEEKQQLSEAIEQETNVHSKERDAAMEKRSVLDEEIRELQKSLDAKMKQRNTFDEAVSSCEIRIASIKSKFEKQLSRLDGKQKRLEEARREVEQDAAQVELMDKELQREREAWMQGAAEEKRQLAAIRSQSRKMRGLRGLTSRHLRMRTRWQQLLEPHQEMLNEARLGWEQATGNCLELASSVNAKETEAAGARSQVEAIRIQLPSLEAEKKQAVASRSFKEAGRLAEEIRRREEERKTYEESLEKIQSELSDHRERLASSRQLEESSQARLMEAEARGGAEEIRILQRQIRDLDKLRKSSSMGATERILFEEEERVFSSARTHLAEKYSIDLSSLEDIPSDPEDLPEEDAEPSEEDTPAGGLDTADVSRPAGVETAEPPASEPVEVEDIETLRQRRDELARREAEIEAEINELETSINEACESENYDAADEMETEKQKKEDLLQDSRRKRAATELRIEEQEKVTPPEAPVEEVAAEAPVEEVAAEAAVEEVAVEDAETERVEAEAHSAEPDTEATEADSLAPATAEPSGFSFVGSSPANDADEATPLEAPVEQNREDDEVVEQEMSVDPDAPADAATDDADLPAAATSSGFSFVGSPDAETVDDAEVPDAEEAPPSGFSFVSGSISADPDGTDAVVEEADNEAPQEDAPPSGFSFIGADDSAKPEEATDSPAEASPGADSEEAEAF